MAVSTVKDTSLEDRITPSWVKDAIFYQIFPDRFAVPKERLGSRDPFGWHGGDLWEAADKLEYLHALGINAIYLNPIFDSSAYHGYWTSDYFSVNPRLGGNGAFDHFLDKAHGLGMRVILDGVFNHTGTDHPEYQELLRLAGKYRTRLQIEGWFGMSELPERNTDNPAVQEEIFRVAEYWIERGADGWRLDVPNEIDDDCFWREFRKRVKAVDPEALIEGELWSKGQRWLQGDMFDGQMNYPLAYAMIGYFLKEKANWGSVVNTGFQDKICAPFDAGTFAARLNDVIWSFPYETSLSQMNLLDSHDTPRLMTLANGDVSAVRNMYLCMFTLPGAPTIYYGDEVGMVGGKDPDCRRDMPWPDEPGRYLAGQLERYREDGDLGHLDPYSRIWDTTLLADIIDYADLRRESGALRRGLFDIVEVDRDVIMYRRKHGDETAVIAFNASPWDREIPGIDPGVEMLEERLTSEPYALRRHEPIYLKAGQGRVWIGKG